jgi:PAS domain S-box-containing protein
MAAKTKPTKKSSRSSDKKKQKKNSPVPPSSDAMTRKQMKDGLVDSERSFRTLAEHAPDIIVRFDKRLRHLYVNQIVEKVTGIPWEQFLGKTNEELGMPEELCALWNRTFKRVWRTGDAQNIEFSFPAPDGARFFELRAVPEQGVEGNIESVMGIARDITERKLRDELLKKERETFYTVLQQAPVGAALIDEEGTYLFINAQFSAITGYTLKDIPTGREWFLKAFPDSEYRGQAIDTWKAHVARTRFDRTFKVVCKGGTVKEIEFKGAVLEDGRSIVMLSDITERKQTEETIRRSRELSNALNCINDVMHASLDPDEIMQQLVMEGTRILDCETAALSIRRKEDWIVRYVHGMPDKLVGLLMSDEEERHAVLALEAGQPVAVSDAFNDGRFNREHLRRHNIRSVMAVPLIAGGRPLGVIFFNFHSTAHPFTDEEVDFARQLSAAASIALENARLYEEQKSAEETLRQARDTLEIRVQERTAELVLVNKQLKEENAERLRAEQSLRLESTRLDALLRLSQMSEVPLDEISAFTLEQAIALTQSKIGFAGFLSEDEAVYTLHAVSKDVVKECAVVGDPMHWQVADAGMWADAIRERKTLFVNDYSKPNPRKHGIPAGHVVMERFMVVPVFEGKKIVAVAGVGNKASDYDKSDERQVALLLKGMWGFVQQNRAREELQKAHDELEEKVELRTAELSASNEALRRLSQFPQENPNPVLRVALGGALLYANEPAREWLLTLGWEVEGPLPAPLEAVVAEAQGQDHAIKTEITNPVDGTFYLFAVQPSGEDYINIYGLDITDRKQTEEAVRKSEERYRGLYDAVSGGVIVQDREGAILEANAVACDILGLTQDQIRGRTSGDSRWRAIQEDGSPLPVDDRPSIRALRTGIAIQGQVMGVFNPAVEQYRWLLVNAEPILDPKTSQVHSVVTTFLDITDRKKREEELQRLNRTLRALSNSNQALMRATEESAYLQDTCKIIVEDCGHKMVWIGYAEDDEAKTVRPVASAGFEEGYLETLRITWADTERGRGPTGTAIRTGKMSMCRNMLTDPDFAPWREQAIKRGYASSIVLPLMTGNKAFGAVNIYSKEPDPFTEDEVELLAELAGDLAYGIQSLRLRAEHAQAEEALRKTYDELEMRVQERTAELRNTKELLEKTMASLVDAVFVVEPVNRTIIACNNAVETMFGYTEGEVTGRNTEFLYVNKKIYEEFGRGLFSALDAKGVYHTEYKMRRKDGTVFPAEITVTEMLDDAGERAGTVSLVRDITERVQAQQEHVRLGKAIEEAIEERLRLAVVMEQTEEGVLILDTHGTIEYVNPVLERLSGYERGKLIGRKSDVLLPYAALGDAMIAVRRGESWRGHVIRRDTGGTPLELDITMSPVRNAEGGIINYVAVERDVTREMQLQRQMRHMQKMEALGTLAGGIAHDLNNILMPITINTELSLDDASEGSRTKHYLQQVLEAANRGTELVRQITTFSRRAEQTEGPTEILPVVKEGLKLLRASLPATIEIRQHLKTGKAMVQVDPVHIHQVLMNLCSNAAAAMSPEGGLLEVSLSSVELDSDAASAYVDLNPGPYMRLTVADTGHGMDESIKERIYDPFFTTKGPNKGTGMGLAVVHGIVTGVGGAIKVYSEKGKGTRFDVYFLQVQGPPKRRSAAPTRPPTGSERILFVDDEEAIVRSVRPLLERLGYRVTTATNSPEALKVFRSQPEGFDLVITDQTMPRMTGIDLAEKIMRIRPGMPVILCTGFSEQMNAQEAQSRGIRAFINKPLTSRGMAEIIRHTLDGKA